MPAHKLSQAGKCKRTRWKVLDLKSESKKRLKDRGNSLAARKSTVNTFAKSRGDWNLQEWKMTDHLKTGGGICRTGK